MEIKAYNTEDFEKININTDLKDIVYFNPVLNKTVKELWKDVVGYEGLYKISNLGRIKRLNYKRWCSMNNCYSKYKDIIIKCCSKQSYLKVGLNKNKIKTTMSLHRLVALHFIDNHENKPYVNHIKGNKQDNRYWMLEWSTPSENSKHSYDILGKVGGNKDRTGNMCKTICQYTLDNIFVKQWESAREVESVIGVQASSVSACCRGQNKTCSGFRWRHEYRPIEQIKRMLEDFPNLRDEILNLLCNDK